MAGQRQHERARNIEPDSGIDILLDKYYPDYIMDKIYANKMNRLEK